MKSKFNAREQSSIISLRKFHNWIKRELLTQTSDALMEDNNFGREHIKLLDLAVGKGGDMQKWYDNKIMHVVGFDIDEDSIREAKNRYNQLISGLKKRGIYNLPVYEFYVMDLSQKENLEKIAHILKDKKFNIVSCQFAIHYFFRDKESLINLMTIVNTYSVKGAYWIGTTVNGDMLIELLKGKNMIGNPIYSIEKKYNDKISSPYNNTYLVGLGESTDTEHYFAGKKSQEYLVTIEELKIVSEKMGFLYIGVIDFELWYKSFGQNIMSSDEIEYSFMNFSFVFKKID
jgi:mRNA (guanine-N7-)-methyltransferase